MEKSADKMLEPYGYFVASKYLSGTHDASVLRAVVGEFRNRIKLVQESHVENVACKKAIKIYDEIVQERLGVKSKVLPCGHEIFRKDIENQLKNPKYVRAKCPKCMYLVLEDDLLDMFCWDRLMAVFPTVDVLFFAAKFPARDGWQNPHRIREGKRDVCFVTIHADWQKYTINTGYVASASKNT